MKKIFLIPLIAITATEISAMNAESGSNLQPKTETQSLRTQKLDEISSKDTPSLGCIDTAPVLGNTAAISSTENFRKVKFNAEKLYSGETNTDFVKFSWGENKDKNSIILNKLEFTGVVPDVTTDLVLVITGEIEGKQVVVAPKAFSNLKADKIRLHIFFARKNGRAVILPKDSSSLFKDSSAIYRIEFRSIDCDRVEDMRDMFNGCRNLSELDLSSFMCDCDLKPDRMIKMFFNCKNLKKINI
ncbi:MAG: hypothetical protein II453_08710, partial [Alphaproteobacteria bacterium]|nr:hypothetical protein [Alphaproteobacteria bacterium]